MEFLFYEMSGKLRSVYYRKNSEQHVKVLEKLRVQRLPQIYGSVMSHKIGLSFFLLSLWLRGGNVRGIKRFKRIA